MLFAGVGGATILAINFLTALITHPGAARARARKHPHNPPTRTRARTHPQVHARPYAHSQTRALARTHTHMRARTHARTHTHKHARTHAPTHTLRRRARQGDRRARGLPPDCGMRQHCTIALYSAAQYSTVPHGTAQSWRSFPVATRHISNRRLQLLTLRRRAATWCSRCNVLRCGLVGPVGSQPSQWVRGPRVVSRQ